MRVLRKNLINIQKNIFNFLLSIIVIAKQFINRNVKVICNSGDHLHVGVSGGRLPARHCLRSYTERISKIFLRASVAAAQLSNFCS